MISAKIGAKFPEKNVAAYKGFMLKGGSFDIRINHDSNLPANGLQHFSLADIINMLGITMSINGKRLEEDLIQWGE